MKLTTLCLNVALTCSFHLCVCQVNPCYQQQADSRVTVVVFLATGCPISQKYLPVLRSIYSQYNSARVNMMAVIPGNIKKKELKKFIREYDIPFPVTTDRNYTCAKEISARVTPEVFVFDSLNIVQYRGAIDNWFYALGGYRSKATEHYLTDAIASLLAGEHPKIDSTNALGCYIEVR